MRDIKFRIWDKQNKIMMIDWENFKFIETITRDIFLRLGTRGGKWTTHIAKTKDYSPMQYTGLKDKNGKEIYEGDIVHYKAEIEQRGGILKHEQVGEIVIDKGMTCFKGKTKQTYADEVNIHDSNFLFLSAEIYEVIGNIYGNTELLEVE